MPELTVSTQIAAPAETVWAILADFGDVSWIPVAGRVEVDGDGPGMSRAIYGSGDSPAIETMTSTDPDTMTLAYRITNNPLPVSRFEAVVSVREVEPAMPASLVTWVVHYNPAGDSASEAKAARESVEAVYGMMAGWLADAATQSPA